MAQVVTFGCRINAFESEAMKEKLSRYPDLIVVNTCAVTSEAERQCRQMIRKLKKQNPASKIIITGCSAQLHPDSFLEMSEVDLVLGNLEKENIEKYVQNITNDKLHISDVMKAQHIDSYMIKGFVGRQKAFVAVQQGCNHRCTYCIVPYARGKNRSMPISKVLEQVNLLNAEGYRKICLTGIDLCSYQYGLSNLVRALLDCAPDLKELSFGSLDPAAVDDEFIKLIEQNKKIAPHFHLSIQSGDNSVLRRMGRRHTREDVISLCSKIRAARHDATFGADFICGFPTETDEAFENTCRLVDEAGINKLHVFPYSEREGTPAAKMEQIAVSVRHARAKKLRAIGEKANG
ncbi:MAG: tRNA (N(6)-L-threonylcarbamoyladenosine(37)-C(2))-methylthiotransferase MtaB [Alphaproteobacteria bacterium]|nr:tRNA (N(6)-L-threonylcarbamoyladenosine(37)-C(2))-methylthiotransferase MtaB [Alphaproteobacteria bacterium]